MLDWWGEIAKHTQAALVTQVAAGANLGHSSSIIRPRPNSPEPAQAAVSRQEPSPPYELPNDKAEVPNTPVVGHAAPLPTAAGTTSAAAGTAAPVAVSTSTTTTTTNGAPPSAALNATNGQTTFLPEKAPIEQDQHLMKRQNSGSTVSLNTSELV